MITTREEIAEWFDIGIELDATHMIIACDTFSYEDFPVYVMSDEDVHAVEKQYSDQGKMLSAMEVYNLKVDKAAQLAQRRAHNY